jgi:cytochrome b subunit of formate dehydrogenase
MLNKKVFLTKFIHLSLFIFMAICLFYILYGCFTRTYHWTLLTAVIVILINGLAIVLNQGRCPLTTLAEKYGAENGAVTHIILPMFCARYVFKFFTALFAIEIIWLGIGYLG